MDKYSFHSGERQTSEHFDEVRADHRNRYILAAELLQAESERASKKLEGLDVFCGSGYGTWYLAQHALKVTGYDGSEESIDFANQNFGHELANFRYSLFPFELEEAAFDYAVCFESIEHVKEDRELVRLLAGSLRRGGLLILSVPNERLLPFETFKASYPFHFKHYTREALNGLVMDAFAGFQCEAWFGQDTYKLRYDPLRRDGLLPESEMDLKLDYEGQTIVSVYRKV